MEIVSIQIPAALYTAIYKHHEEQTGNVINDCLKRLIELDQSESSSQSTETWHYPRPGKGTITGKVWEIADQLNKESGEANRTEVITKCVEEGININTANTQYSHWKASPYKSEE